MRLGDLIQCLERYPASRRVERGFGAASSYRGYYEDVAFCYAADTTVGEMLSIAKGALGSTFTGWKGGEYTMSEYSECWICEEGTTENATGLSSFVVDLMVGGHPK